MTLATIDIDRPCLGLRDNSRTNISRIAYFIIFISNCALADIRPSIVSTQG
jgi:hypothetical protein